MFPSETRGATRAEALARELEALADYRVLRRFVPRRRYVEESWNLGEPSADTRIGLYVDSETTGLDRERDEAIELAGVPFSFNRHTGEVYDVLPGFQMLQEPRGGIAEEVTAIHGLTLEMVRGKRFDVPMVNGLLAQCALCVAHNAEFDRPILERAIPKFADVHWACSQQEVPWERTFGCRAARLQVVLADACREFTTAGHRALEDCQIGVHVLAAACAGGRSALSYLLESARTPTIRMWALDSPFAMKEALRAHRPKYHWCDGKTPGTRKGWYVDVTPATLEAEKEWLLATIYSGRAEERHVIRLVQFTAKDRYSLRSLTETR